MFTEDAGSVRRGVVAESEQQVPSRTVVSVHWQQVPALDVELNHVLQAMAEAALELWPRWYATVDERFDRSHWPMAETECRLEEARVRVMGVSAAWFRRAWSACQSHQVPVVKTLSSAEQLRQLALAMDPGGPLVFLAVSSNDASPTRIHTLARAAEWLAQQTQSETILALPEEWSKHSELDVVSYDAIRWLAFDEGTAELPLPSDRPRILIEPFIGHPHPSSQHEQRLHKWITQDAELSPLFQFNRKAVGHLGAAYCVDLLWPEGKLVVEIDGDDHRSPSKFQHDRERDYRLLLAGYTVLRVTNDDVLRDTELVVERIRNVVRFKQSNESRGT